MLILYNIFFMDEFIYLYVKFAMKKLKMPRYKKLINFNLFIYF